MHIVIASPTRIEARNMIRSEYTANESLQRAAVPSWQRPAPVRAVRRSNVVAMVSGCMVITGLSILAALIITF
jgi:hypothetical protein